MENFAEIFVVAVVVFDVEIVEIRIDIVKKEVVVETLADL